MQFYAIFLHFFRFLPQSHNLENGRCNYLRPFLHCFIRERKCFYYFVAMNVNFCQIDIFLQILAVSGFFGVLFHFCWEMISTKKNPTSWTISFPATKLLVDFFFTFFDYLYLLANKFHSFGVSMLPELEFFC